MTEEQTARLVFAYLARGLIVAMVVVGLYAQVHTQRGADWSLLWVAVAALLGSAAVDYLVRTVARLAHTD